MTNVDTIQQSVEPIRYRWLARYLKVLQVAACFMLVIGPIASVACFCLALQSRASDAPTGFVVGVVWLLMSAFQFIAAFALVDFIRVVMGIEQGIRRLVERA
jgi:hypothetical protein